MSVPIPEVNNWRAFEQYAQRYFSNLWGVDIQERSVRVANLVSRKFDLVSEDHRYIGDAKWLSHTPPYNGAKPQAIVECLWLLQKVRTEKVFLVLGRDIGIVEEFLRRWRPLIDPVEFYFLDGSGHQLL